MLEDEKEIEQKNNFKQPQLPVGIIKIKDGNVWLSIKQKKYCKPNSIKIPYDIAKIKYPHLVAERLLYDKMKFVVATNNYENQEQACLFDFNGKDCLVKWYPSEQFSWITKEQTDPFILLEYLELQNFRKVSLVEK